VSAAPLDPAVAAALADADLPADLVGWLARFRVLHGVPFEHLVPDPRLLPPESIRFFRVDPSWLAALVDGALSPGRSYGTATVAAPSLVPEQVHRAGLEAGAAAAAPDVRRAQVGQPALGDGAAGEVTGFLLRSAAVGAWKSMDVAGYAAGSSPYDVERGRATPDAVRALDVLRLERLGAGVLFGLFAGTLYQLVLHQPPEAVHFGFGSVDLAGGSATKDLRVPTPGWDDPDAAYDSQKWQDQPLKGVFADRDRRVVDLQATSRALAARLAAVGAAPGYYQAEPDADHRDHLIASDFALEMVQGVGLVSFVNDTLPGTDSA
jgi:hypothetical protein